MGITQTQSIGSVIINSTLTLLLCCSNKGEFRSDSVTDVWLTVLNYSHKNVFDKILK